MGFRARGRRSAVVGLLACGLVACGKLYGEDPTATPGLESDSGGVVGQLPDGAATPDGSAVGGDEAGVDSGGPCPVCPVGDTCLASGGRGAGTIANSCGAPLDVAGAVQRTIFLRPDGPTFTLPAHARLPSMVEEVFRVRHVLGAAASRFNAWLTLRGLRSLACRMERHSTNAALVAKAMAESPDVEVVHYPGLASHPGHDVARRQMRGGFGGMVSIEVRGGRGAAVRTASNLRLFVNATSLRGPESLVEHRASTEGPSSRTPGGLLPLSVGLEHPDDLVEDLTRALAEAASA